MTSPTQPRLGRWKDQCIPPVDRHVVILVHGILSDSSTFDRLLSLLDERDTGEVFDFWIFDYDYLQPLRVSGDQLAMAIRERAFGDRRVDIVGHSMGGLVARMAVIRNNLPNVHRVVTLATPNHGTISGTQLNLLGQMTTLGLRRFHPIYARASGILELTDVHSILKAELQAMGVATRTHLDGKSYVSIPAQYFHTKRQWGEPPPSLTMGGLTLARRLVNFFRLLRINLSPVHDGIVEERSNQLHPSPTGSSDEGTYMPSRRDVAERILHVTHDAAADCDHVTITASAEIADLIQAVLLAKTLDEAGIDPLLNCLPCQVKVRPPVA